MKKQICRFALLGICSLFFVANGGCAFVDNRIELPYTECTSGYRGTGDIEIEKPQTSLPQKDGLTVVGYVRNGFQMHTADVLATNNVGDWIVLALSKELGAAGYEVHPVSGLSNSSIGLRVNDVKVLADIEQFRLVAKVGYNVDVIDGNQHRQSISASGEGVHLPVP